jgi:hypothetical protein
MQPVSLDRSLAKLVATGWHVVGVTLSGRMFHCYLVAERVLAICVVDRLPDLPASRCVCLDPASR